MLIRRALLITTIASMTVLGTAGCNLMAPVTSLKTYAPSDGAQGDLGSIHARNLIYFTDNAGNSGLFGAFANSSNEDAQFALGFYNKAGKLNFRAFTVKAHQVLNFGYQGKNPLKINLTGKPGDIVSVYLAAEELPVTINVPVMDATLPEYQEAVDSLSGN